MKTRNRLAAFIVGIGISLVAWAGLETGTYISDLVATNPLSSDLASTSDDHLRLIKSTIKNTFPNISNAVTSSHTELNLLHGLSGTIWTSNNDGPGSGLDADTIDTINSTDLARLSQIPNFTGGQVIVTGTDPDFVLMESDTGTDEKRWHMRANANNWRLTLATDAGVDTTNAISVARTGTTVDSIELEATSVLTNGVDATASTGTFTCTGTGFSDPDPTGTCRYVKFGNMVTLFIPHLEGTSDATTFTVTGAPAAIQPTRAQLLRSVRGEDSSIAQDDIQVRVETSGTITYINGADPNGWSSSGTKTNSRPDDGHTITYILN